MSSFISTTVTGGLTDLPHPLCRLYFHPSVLGLPNVGTNHPLLSTPATLLGHQAALLAPAGLCDHVTRQDTLPKTVLRCCRCSGGQRKNWKNFCGRPVQDLFHVAHNTCRWRVNLISSRVYPRAPQRHIPVKGRMNE